MLLPLVGILGGGIAGALGIGVGVKGGLDLKNANDKLEEAKKTHKHNIRELEKQNKKTISLMDEIGEKEMEILNNFKDFQRVLEKIKNRPVFEDIIKDNVNVPKFTIKEMEEVSIGAGILLGGLGGAVFGSAGGFAAAGGTTAAVMALGTASTGTAISALSGVAATNATLAALGGGALAAGGGGMALGATVLGVATGGVALLVGGAIFALVGSSISGKTDKACEEILKSDNEIRRIYAYLQDLYDCSSNFYEYLTKVNDVYQEEFKKLAFIVDDLERTNYSEYNEKERAILENIVSLVALLYNMCKTQLVKNTENNDLNEVNKEGIRTAIQNIMSYTIK